MEGVLPVQAGFEPTPWHLTLIAQVDTHAVVVRHVHVLIRIALIRDVLFTELQGDPLATALSCHRDRLVDALEERVEHLVAMTILVAVGLGVRARVLDAEAVVGEGRLHVFREAVVDAATGQRQAAAADPLSCCISEAGRPGLGIDHAGDVVATAADGSQTCHHFGVGQLAGRCIGQWRIHVVAACSRGIGAVDEDLDAIAGQPANGGQA